MWKHLFTSNCKSSSIVRKDIHPVYRLVDSHSIKLSDFEPHIVKFPNKPHQNKCIASGTSVYDDYSAIASMQRRIPAFKNKLIAKGSIARSDGAIRQGTGGRRHVTWWIFINDPQAKFRALP